MIEYLNIIIVANVNKTGTSIELIREVVRTMHVLFGNTQSLKSHLACFERAKYSFFEGCNSSSF